jgi:hypothetical protein
MRLLQIIAGALCLGNQLAVSLLADIRVAVIPFGPSVELSPIGLFSSEHEACCFLNIFKT